MRSELESLLLVHCDPFLLFVALIPLLLHFVTFVCSIACPVSVWSQKNLPMMNGHIYTPYSPIISNFLALQAAFTCSGGMVLQGNLVLQYFQVLQCCSLSK